MFGGEGEFLDTERDGEGKDEGVEQDQSQDLNKERDVFNGLYCCDLATNQWTLHATSVRTCTLQALLLVLLFVELGRQVNASTKLHDSLVFLIGFGLNAQPTWWTPWALFSCDF